MSGGRLEQPIAKDWLIVESRSRFNQNNMLALGLCRVFIPLSVAFMTWRSLVTFGESPGEFAGTNE